MYIVINPDHTLVTHSEHVDAQVIRRIVGEPGFDMFPLDRPPTMYAFVNDEGLFDRQAHPLNVTGGAVCATLNGRPNILAGKVVITGWNSHANGPEITDLTVDQAALVEQIHTNVLRALDGDELGYVGAEDWSDRVRSYAEHVHANA